MKKTHKHRAVLTASTLGLTGLASATTFGGEKYTYDGSGNIVEKSIDGQVTKMSYDASNKLTSIDAAAKSSEHISYDAAGRPISYNDASGQATRQLSYGYADNVLKANSTSGNAEFFYNAEGQIVGKTAGGYTTSYTWDGNVLAAEDADIFTNESHITGGVPLLESGREIVVSDYLGNTLSSGCVELSTTAYGESFETNRLTGKPFIKELECYVFSYRLYSAREVRWTTRDPIGYPDGSNNYSYVFDPNKELDPEGTKVTEMTNTLAPPSTPSGSLTAPFGVLPWSGTGISYPGSYGSKGFQAILSHTSADVNSPKPSQIKLAVQITADDPNKIIYFTPLSNIYQANGVQSAMGLTAKMSPNGKSSITATVTGGVAVGSGALTNVGGVTDSPNAANVTLSGSGVVLSFGGGSWKWEEN